MRQGTTPKHTFTIPFDASNVEKVRVYYAQKDIVRVTKTEADVTMDGNIMTLIQLKVVTKDGNSFVKEICFNFIKSPPWVYYSIKAEEGQE